MFKPTSLLLLFVCLLNGCATTEYAQSSADMDPAAVKLAEAASAVTESLQHLEMIQQAAHPNAKVPEPPPADSFGMGNLASMDWSGPIEPLVRNIADATQYKLRVMGKAPAMPVIISITAADTTFADLLRDTGFQAGDRANIVVFPKTRVIELRYAEA